MRNNQKSFRKLVVYQKSKQLVIEVYQLTKSYPKTETYTLVPQMRRAAMSVSANIVEGYAKDSSKEFARFLTISIGSLTELEVYLDMSQELGFINKIEYAKMTDLQLEVKKLLYGFRKAVRGRF